MKAVIERLVVVSEEVSDMKHCAASLDVVEAEMRMKMVAMLDRSAMLKQTIDPRTIRLNPILEINAKVSTFREMEA